MPNPAHSRTPFAKVFGNAERVRWPRAGGYGPSPAGSGLMPAHTTGGAGGAHWTWTRAGGQHPHRPRPRKHGLSCAKGDVSPLGESRGGTPTGERAPSKAFLANG